MAAERPRGDAFLAGRTLRPRAGADARRERGHLGLGRRSGDQLGHQRMLRRQAHERRPEDRVGPRREDGDLARTAVERKADLRARAAADPVALHGDDALRPALQPIEIGQQLLRVRRDAEEPLLQLALLDRSVAAPAGAVAHLLVRQHGLAARAPVDRAAALVGEPALQHAQEEELLPAVVRGIAGGQLAVPVVGEAEPAQLRPHARDVVLGPARRMAPVLDGRILRREAERVPPDRMEHPEARHPALARDHVADRVVAHVPHVDVPRRVREHLEHVVRWSARVDDGVEGSLGRPARLPLRLQRLSVVVRRPLPCPHSA